MYKIQGMLQIIFILGIQKNFPIMQHVRLLFLLQILPTPKPLKDLVYGDITYYVSLNEDDPVI